MSWQCSRWVSIGFFGVASGVALSAATAPARADEAYLCGPDKVVYVSTADLPRMKRTDACIAAYYGLTVEASARPADAAQAVATAASTKAAAKAVLVDLKPVVDVDPPLRDGAQTVRHASLAPPRAAPDTDFRNVKILNAADPGEAWFRHTK